MTAEFDEDRFNMAIRKFLKHVGVSSQREIETWCAGGSKGWQARTANDPVR